MISPENCYYESEIRRAVLEQIGPDHKLRLEAKRWYFWIDDQEKLQLRRYFNPFRANKYTFDLADPNLIDNIIDWIRSKNKE